MLPHLRRKGRREEGEEKSILSYNKALNLKATFNVLWITKETQLSLLVT
jgi:hypothetical protein